MSASATAQSSNFSKYPRHYCRKFSIALGNEMPVLGLPEGSGGKLKLGRFAYKKRVTANMNAAPNTVATIVQ